MASKNGKSFSRSERFQLLGLAFANALYLMLHDQYNADDREYFLDIAKPIVDECDKAFNVYGKYLTARQINAIDNIVKTMKSEIFNSDGEPFQAFTNLTIGMLEDIQGKIKKQDKKDLFENVINQAWNIHAHFDAGNEDDESIEKATRAIRRLEQLADNI